MTIDELITLLCAIDAGDNPEISLGLGRRILALEDEGLLDNVAMLLTEAEKEKMPELGDEV